MAELTDPDTIREQVREKYAAAARAKSDCCKEATAPPSRCVCSPA